MVDKDILVSRIYLRAALPLIKVLAAEQPLYRKAFPKAGVLQFTTKENPEVGAYVAFEEGELIVEPKIHEHPDLTVTFKKVANLNAFFGGKMGPEVIPSFKGLRHIDLLLRVLPLLLGLKLLMPEAKPKTEEKRRLKVKLLLFMVTNALSQLNKAGDPKFCKLTDKSPDRIFQWIVEGEPDHAAYLRVKNGKSKAGRGVYKRRRPFVLMKFPNIDGAYKVLTSEVPLVEAVSRGLVVTEGAMEGSKEIGYHMQRIEELTKV